MKARRALTKRGIVTLMFAGMIAWGFPVFSWWRDTQLRNALTYGDTARVAFLLNRAKANPDADVCTEQEPMTWQDWFPPFVRQIKLPQTCSRTESLLVFASHKPSAPRVIAALLKAGANPNAKGQFDCPPLQAVVMREDVESARLLLRAGADPNASPYGNTSLGLAVYEQNLPLSALLLAHGAAPNQMYNHDLPAILAIKNDDLPMLKLLIARGAKLSTEDSYGSPLFHAASNNSLECFYFLLQKRIKVNDRAADGMTALMEATESSRLQAVKLLLAHGANPNVQTPDGRTALDFIDYDGATKRQRQIARLLKRYGAHAGKPTLRTASPDLSARE